jgi:hypothetical protein
MKTAFYSLFLLVSASLCLAADKSREVESDDIREVVFRWQFDHNASRQNRNPEVYFLAVGEKDRDPSAVFMKRFTGNKPPLRRASQCRKSTRGVFDKKTGERGLVFRVERIEWKSDSQVDVDGGYYEDGMSASGNTYTVQKTKGKWKVTNDEMHWISYG